MDWPEPTGAVAVEAPVPDSILAAILIHPT